MTIREKVARAIDPEAWRFWDWGEMERQRCDETLAITDDVITAFLEAAAERGWHMRPDEATEEMVKRGSVLHPDFNRARYRAMLAAAPKFEWDK